MAKFHRLRVVDITRETPDCVSVRFEIPDSLREDYTYVQGQYLTLRMVVGRQEIRRSYSICSSPVADTEVRIAVKRVAGGLGSTYLNQELKVGDVLDVMTPMGNFHSPMDPAHKKQYVLFAGGSGITPMLSIIKTVLHLEPLSTVILFYGNLNEESVIFRAQLAGLVGTNPGRLTVHHILDQPSEAVDGLYRGIMTTEKVQALIEHHVGLSLDNEFFICGPTPMMDNVRGVLENLRTEPSRIHIEYFTASLEAVNRAEAEAEAPPVKRFVAQVTIIMDDEEHSVELPSDGMAILDAALSAGLDVPFSCKGAVCCTCRARVTEGKARMTKNFALTKEEVEAGYVLTCQSHPLTPLLVVDYDAV